MRGNALIATIVMIAVIMRDTAAALRPPKMGTLHASFLMGLPLFRDLDTRPRHAQPTRHRIAVSGD
jgi:hypothetical protein